MLAGALAGSTGFVTDGLVVGVGFNEVCTDAAALVGVICEVLLMNSNMSEYPISDFCLGVL